MFHIASNEPVLWSRCSYKDGTYVYVPRRHDDARARDVNGRKRLGDASRPSDCLPIRRRVIFTDSTAAPRFDATLDDDDARDDDAAVSRARRGGGARRARAASRDVRDARRGRARAAGASNESNE